MRVTFSPPSVREFDILFKDEDSALKSRGGSLSDINVYVPQTPRGGSIFGLLAKVAKTVAPILVRTILPEGINFANNVMRDVSSGKKVKQSLKRRGLQSLGRVGKKIVRGGSKKKRKRVKKIKNMKSRKRKRYNDVFESI